MSIDIGYKDPAGVWRLIGSVPIPSTPTPTPASSLYDDFQGALYSLMGGQTSPNGKWKCIYGACQTLSNSNGWHYMNLAPKASTAPSETHSSLVATTTSFKDFDLSFDIQTIKQLRTGSAPNNWEVGWILWNRPTDDFHLYGFEAKIKGWELQKKDNETQNDAAQIFLQTGNAPSITVGKWQHWRVKVTGTTTGTPTISVWIDGALVVSLTDNKSQPNSPTMLLGGPILLYCEDSSVGYANVNITPL